MYSSISHSLRSQNGDGDFVCSYDCLDVCECRRALAVCWFWEGVSCCFWKTILCSSWVTAYLIFFSRFCCAIYWTWAFWTSRFLSKSSWRAFSFYWISSCSFASAFWLKASFSWAKVYFAFCFWSRNLSSFSSQIFTRFFLYCSFFTKSGIARIWGYTDIRVMSCCSI